MKLLKVLVRPSETEQGNNYNALISLRHIMCGTLNDYKALYIPLLKIVHTWQYPRSCASGSHEFAIDATLPT